MTVLLLALVAVMAVSEPVAQVAQHDTAVVAYSGKLQMADLCHKPCFVEVVQNLCVLQCMHSAWHMGRSKKRASIPQQHSHTVTNLSGAKC